MEIKNLRQVGTNRHMNYISWAVHSPCTRTYQCLKPHAYKYVRIDEHYLHVLVRPSYQASTPLPTIKAPKPRDPTKLGQV